MKTFKILLPFLSFIIFSCSKADDSPAPSSEQLPNIEGEWELEEYYYTRSTTITNNEDEHTNTYDAVAKDLNVILTIDTEPNIYSIAGDYILVISTIEKGETVEKEIDVKNLSDSGEFWYDDIRFELLEKDSGLPGFPEPGVINLMSFHFQIDDLTENRLELTLNEVHSFSENEKPVKVHTIGTQVYRRL